VVDDAVVVAVVVVRDDDGCESNCLTRSFMRPGRVGTGDGFEAGVGIEEAGLETDR
jgi:hypothetical protein